MGHAETRRRREMRIGLATLRLSVRNSDLVHAGVEAWKKCIGFPVSALPRFRDLHWNSCALLCLFVANYPIPPVDLAIGALHCLTSRWLISSPTNPPSSSARS